MPVAIIRLIRNGWITMRALKLISFRLFILIIFVLSVFTFIESYLQIKTQRENYEEMVVSWGMRACSLIQGVLSQAMISDTKKEAYKLIESVASQGAIEKIRIYNKKGKIIFSSAAEEINRTVDMHNEACFMCHKSEDDVIKEPITSERKRIYNSQKGYRLLGVVGAIKNNESCYNSDCHYHDKNESLLGTLDVILSLKETDQILEEETSLMISNNISITLILALLVGGFLWVFVHIPVKRLTKATKAISSGNLDYNIKMYSNDEIGQLSHSFNKMTEDLKAAKHEITNWSIELENRVHEKTEELKKTQERILQIEKMASLGKLSATVAHEINNPLAGILTYSKLIQRKLRKENKTEKDIETILKNLEMIETESDRCGNIIKNLLLFSRKHDIEIHKNDLNNVIDSSLQLIDHHLHLHNIRVQKVFDRMMPEVYLDQNLIKQSLLAIYLNAIEAMDSEGILKVETRYRPNEKKAEIIVQDNGRGMSDEIKKSIFEPFFTTKKEVKGVGLGLATVYGIVKKHHGEIIVDSEINKGTTFKIKLPLEKIMSENDE